MPRASEADVRAILPTEATITTIQIDMAIVSANCVVDQIAGGCASHLNDTCLKQVEIYLAAHYAAVTENTLTISSEKDGCCDASVTYGFKFGMGVNGTPFGQAANTLSSGCLAEMDKPAARLFSIGTIGRC